ncbi:MAG TPA: alpha/beta hydrolase [Pseudobdellovibrionaceae bacterium]|jgi:pimeloyl-ACP methyl ester carboxylesterase
MFYLDLYNYQIIGPENGRRWVFVHGLMGYGANWRKIISSLESTERVLCFDQRGHGRSQKPAEGYTPEDYSEDILKITEELGWDKFILVGHSMGGRNVLNFAYRYPEKIIKLVVEDIGPEAAPNAVEYYEKLLEMVPTPFPNREAARSFFQTEFLEKAKTRENPQVLAQFLYANIEDKADGTVDWRFYKQGILDSVSDGRNKDRWHEVISLKVPTLWIHGAQSREFSRENFERVLDSNELITGVEIPNAGHWVHSEQPALFLQALKDFAGGF